MGHPYRGTSNRLEKGAADVRMSRRLYEEMRTPNRVVDSL